jgi:hypothetical protein
MDSISNMHLSVGDLHDSFGPSTTHALETISLEHIFTDEDHTRLDNEIMEAYSAFCMLKMRPNSSELLSRITQMDILTWLNTDEAKKLISREPSIEQKLVDGWQKQSFKAVRQLGVFALPSLSIFELLNITAAILWPEVQEQPKRFVVPIEQRASTCPCVFTLSHSIFLFS